MRQLKIIKSITNRNIGSLDKFLQDISKEELITPEEEVQLAQRIKAGDEVALEKLVKSNLRFVISVAKQYQNQGLSLPDLINEGNIGLIKAARRFDETRGFKFISFAVWWIRQSILQALAEKSRIVRLPLNQVGAINKLKKVSSRLEQQLERTPSDEELAEEMDLKLKMAALDGNHRFLSAPLAKIQQEMYTFRKKGEGFGEISREEQQESVNIIEAANARLEMEAVAADILRLVRDKGYKWQEIGVLIRDQETYGASLPLVFQDYGIPYFSDHKRP